MNQNKNRSDTLAKPLTKTEDTLVFADFSTLVKSVSKPELTITEQKTSHSLTLAQARQKALQDSKKAQQAQIDYAEAEAKRYYDYQVD